ncbi:hypothetical protein C7212DRAFT_167835 [Tuber magnatum]|uniref:Uncharacterized protein n=1 Tax=Tuber magnatum TaxID=42249 RepID=A0A317SWX1_9PEZI|nr:hypothetical protein C7212DRAFT_167835 [Tuber magnatum]
MAASDIDGTSDRERIDALRADVQALRADVQVIGTDVQALTSLFEGFSTRTAEDATMHWQLSGESKVRLDHLDQMMQTLRLRLSCYKHLLLNQRLRQQRANPNGGNDISLWLFVCLFVYFSVVKHDGYQ